MHKLMEAGLYGSGLVRVNTHEMVERYNECLDDLGKPKTSLKSFAIDGMGWSPEIADEMQDWHYLSHGFENNLGIVLGVNQRLKPVYCLFNSYDRELMKEYFERFAREIADITTTRGICLDIDVGLSRFNSPCDLFAVRDVVVGSHLGELGKAAREQNELDRLFREGLNWANRSLQSAIVASAKTYGDLRKRHLTIPDMLYGGTRCYHTHAFNGVFVFRDGISAAGGLAVLEDTDWPGVSCGADHLVVPLNDACLLDELLKRHLATIDLDWYAANVDHLEKMVEYFEAEIICQERPDVFYADLTESQRKHCLRNMGDRVPEVYYELDRFAHFLSNGDSGRLGSFSNELSLILAHPRDVLSSSTSLLVWRLLLRMQSEPIDVFRLYIMDKEYFFDRYAQWPESKQVWATDLIKNQYRPRMNK